MSFREKSAWISFCVVLLSFGVYFADVGHDLWHASFAAPAALLRLLPLVIGIVILQTALHVYVAAREPDAARAPRDEREQLIELKAIRPAYFMLVMGAMFCIGASIFGAPAWPIVLGVLFFVWIAELTRFGTQLYGYRRGA